MAKHGREILVPWVEEALRANGGSATIMEVAKYIWNRHESDIVNAGDLLYEWQYEMRWAANLLRQESKIAPAETSPRGLWILLNES